MAEDSEAEKPGAELAAVSEMVERVAKAIYSHEDYFGWEVMGEEWHNNWRKIARGAIAAMREPTQHMQDTYSETLGWMADTPMGHQQREAWREENRRRWQLMINAILGNAAAGSEGEAETESARLVTRFGQVAPSVTETGKAGSADQPKEEEASA